MQDTDLFHKLTMPMGGRFHREEAPVEARLAYDEIAERANNLIAVTRDQLQTLPPICFDFIQNSSINAVAFKAVGKYFIGINTGTIFMLQSVLGRILSDARLFRRVGDPSKELKDLEPLSDYSTDADEMLRKMALMTPSDPIRASYAWFLQDQAIIFLIGHEISHITSGHVYYLSKQGHVITKEIDEEGKRDGDEVLQRQAMEMDADGRSIFSRIDSLRVTFENPAMPPLPWAPSAQGPGQLIRDWAVSLNVVFHLFGEKYFTIGELKESNHPPIVLRQIMCNAVAATDIVRTWDHNLEATALESLDAAVGETNDAFATILGLEFVSAPEADKSALYTRGQQLKDMWNSRLRHVIQKFAFDF